MTIEERDRRGLALAIEQARIGAKEGGVPIGAALVADDGTMLGAGHNRRVQWNSAIRHGETDALEEAGALPGQRAAQVVSTLRSVMAAA